MQVSGKWMAAAALCGKLRPASLWLCQGSSICCMPFRTSHAAGIIPGCRERRALGTRHGTRWGKALRCPGPMGGSAATMVLWPLC